MMMNTNGNKVQRTLLASVTVLCISGPMSVAVPTAFAAASSSEAVQTKSGGSVQLATATTGNSVLNSDLSAAAEWMNKNAATKMPDWTAVAEYAASGKFADVVFPKTYLSSLKTSTDYARAILGILADGQDPHSFQGVNLVAKLSATQLTSGANRGKFTDNIDQTGTDLINNQFWAIIALEDAGGASYNRVAAANWLIAHQNKDGGFGYSSKYSSSDADDTAAAIVALRLLGYSKDSAPISSALAYLKTQQASDGGIVNGSTSSNSDSTGVTLDALASLGLGSGWLTTKDNQTPLTALLSFYDPKTGGFKFDNTGSEWSGVSALSTRDSVFGLAAVKSGSSVYQRLQVHNLNQLDPYWAHIYQSGGAWFNHRYLTWSELRSMAIAGSYLADLTPAWQQVVAAHGEWVTKSSHKSWISWGPKLANEALLDSFGLDAMHLNLLPIVN